MVSHSTTKTTGQLNFHTCLSISFFLQTVMEQSGWLQTKTKYTDGIQMHKDR